MHLEDRVTPASSFSIDDVMKNEGNAGTTNFTFTVSLAVDPADFGETVTVKYRTLDGSATQPGDYTKINQTTLSFSPVPGDTTLTQTVNVVVKGDSTVEADETFTVLLSNPNSTSGTTPTLTNNTGTGTILNDDTSILTFSAPSVTEGNTGTTTLTYVVTSPNAVDGGFKVDVKTLTSGTATAGSDFTAIAGQTLTFVGNAGETQSFSVTVNGDALVEANETVDVAFVAGSVTAATVDPAAIVTTATGTGTINNDDKSTLTFSTPSVTEGDAGAVNLTFTVTSPNAVDGGFKVDVKTLTSGTATAGSDFTAIAGQTLTFVGNAGETQSFSVTVNGDALVEANETVDVAFVAGSVTAATVDPAAIVTTATGTGTINNDDTSVATIQSAASGTDPNGTSATSTTSVDFTITLSKPVDVATVVSVTLASGTATAGADFKGAQIDVTIPAGMTTGTASVPIIDDNIVEFSENFTATITNFVTVSGTRSLGIGAGGTNKGTGTILDADQATISINSPSATEGGTLGFLVSIDKPVDAAITADRTTADGPGGQASSATDYNAIANSNVTLFAKGNTTSFPISVTTKTDSLIEGTETLSVILSNLAASNLNVVFSGGGASLAGTGTILDANKASLAITGQSVNEATGKVTFTITLTGDVAGGFSVDYATADGVGASGATTADNDYTAASGTLTFAGTSGETKTVDVTITDDTKVEANETFTMALSNVTPSQVASGIVITGSPATGTIKNDDSSTITFDSPTVTEGTGGTKTLTFTATLSAAVQGGVSVLASTVDGSATSTGVGVGNSDFTPIANQALVFAGTAGETQTFVVTINPDSVVEQPTETFTAQLGTVTPGNAAIPTTKFTTADGTGSITDDDAATITFDSPTVTEGTGGTKTLTFTATLSAAVQGGVSVLASTVDGTATSTGVGVGNSDFTPIANQKLSFTGTQGETKSFVVTINPDGVVEQPTETFTAQLGTPTAGNAAIVGVITSSNGTGSITDDDSTTISLNSVSHLEGNTGTTSYLFTATLSNAVQGGFTVAFNTADDTATLADNDYQANSGTLTFAGTAGETQTFTVLVNGDKTVEADEAFKAQLGTVTPGNVAISTAKFTATNGVGTITNDDSATLSVDSPTIVEGDSGSKLLMFTITLTGNVAGGFDVAYSTADGSATVASGDYVATSGTFSFAGTSGESKTFTVQINGDTIVEADETFAVQLGAITKTSGKAASSIAKTNGTGTILNDDAATITFDSPTVTEGTGGTKTLTFTATLSAAVQGGVSVLASTVDGTATTTNTGPGTTDFTPIAGQTLTFAGNAGETKTFTVTINPDSVVEQPTETLTAHLGTPTPGNAAIAAGTITTVDGTGTITDDDSTAFTIGNVTQAEDAGKMTFTVTLTNAVQGGLTVQYKTTDGTAVSTNAGVVGDNDFVAATGTLTFAGTAGETKTFQVTINADNVVEPTEQFSVSLLNVVPTNPLIPAAKVNATATATGTITNDDAATVSISDAAATEGGNVTFTISLSGAVDVPVTLTFDTASGTAVGGATMTQGTDFISQNAVTITFAPGETTKTVSIATVDDLRVEGTETFAATVTNLVTTANVSIADGNGVGTITDNDAATLTFDAAASGFSENNATQTVGLTLTVTPTGTVGVAGLDRDIDPGVTTGGTATKGSGPLADYRFNNLTAPAFPSGSNGTTFNRTVSIDVFEDLTNEGDETVILSFGNKADGSNGQLSIGANPTHTFTIQNDDATNRTYDATAAGTYKLVRNGGNVELYLGAALIARDAIGTAPIIINGTAGAETFVIDYSGGNPVPTGGVSVNGGGGADAVQVVNGAFTTVTDSLTNATDGTIVLDGSTVNYLGTEDVQLNVPVANLTLNLPSATTLDALLQDSGGQSKLTGSTLTPTTFNKPSASLAVNRGTANDAITVGPLAGHTANVTVGSAGGLFKTLTQGGAVTTAGDVSYSGDTVAVNGALTAANVTLVAGTAATQSAKIATGVLTLGQAGNAGNYALTNGANDAVTLTVPQAGSVTYADANNLTLGNAKATNALTVSAAKSVVVTPGVTVQSTAGGVALNAGDDFTATGAKLSAATTIGILIDTDNSGGATADLRTATITAALTTIAGNNQADTFRVTGYTTPVNIDGKNPTTFPGDTLEFDAEGKALTVSVNSFSTAGAPVSYVNIETVKVVNPGTGFTLLGTAGDDRVTVTRTPTGPLQYQFDGQPAVAIPGVSSFTFNGGAGRDTLVVDYSNGSPVPAGGITFNGEADADFGIALIGAGAASAVVKATTTGADLTGAVTVNGTDTITYAGLEAASEIDVSNVATATVDLTAVADGVTIAGSTANSATRLTAANTLNVSGASKLPTVRLSSVTNAAVNTNPAATNTVTINGGANAHNVTNLTLTAPSDVVTGKAPLQVAGKLTVLGKDIVLQNGGDLTAGGDLTVTANGTLAVAAAKLTTGGNLAVTAGAAASIGAAALTAAGNVVLTNNAGLSVGPATIVGQTVTQKTANPVTLTGGVAFVQAKATAGDTVVFNGPVDGPGGLMVFNAANTVFNKAVGATTPLSDLVTDAGGQTVVAGGLVRTSGQQYYNDRVVTTTNAQLVGTAGAITFADDVAPATNGLDLVVGGPNVDVVVGGKGVNAATKFGTLTVANAKNASFFGPVTALTKVAQTNGTGTTTFVGPVTAPTVQIDNGHDVTFIGAVAVDRLVQTTGNGTTTLNDVTATSNAPVTGGKDGGAVNVTNASLVLNGNVKTPAGAVVLGLIGGTATQGAATATANPSIVAQQLYLTGAGAFTLTNKANAFAAPTQGAGDVFAKLAGGSINVYDSTPLVIAFDPNNTGAPAIAIDAPAAGTDAVTLSTAGAFTALDPAITDDAPVATVTALTPMFRTPGANVQVNFGSGAFAPNTKSFIVQYRAEATASLVTIGRPVSPNPDPLANAVRDVFLVRPMVGAPLVVNGNDPPVGVSITIGDSLKLQSNGIANVQLSPTGSGNGVYNFPGVGYKSLTFTSIEDLGGLSVEAFAVQTAPRQGSTATNGYAIRVIGTAVTTTLDDSGNSSVTGGGTIAGNITGSGVPTNPFVVSPALGTIFGAATPPSIAFGDVNGDGTPDLIIGNGAGSNPTITIINGRALTSLTNQAGTLDLSNLKPGQLIAQFDAYEPAFQGGVNVAAANFDNGKPGDDGTAEVIVGSGVGGGPLVKVFSGTQITAKGTAFNGTQPGDLYVAPFFAYEQSFRGGVNVAAGDLNGDRTPDLIAGAGVGGGPRVRIYNGADTNTLLNDFFAYEPAYRGGVLVAAGRFDGDAIADLMTAPGSNGGPRLRIFLGGTPIDPTLPNAATYNQQHSLFTPTPFSVVDQFAFPTTAVGGLIPGTDPNALGVGSISFGASTDGAGGNRTVLVSRPRGTSFQIYRYTQTAFNSLALTLNDPLITIADPTHYEDTINGGSHFLDLRDGVTPAINFDQLIAGGSVAGGTF